VSDRYSARHGGTIKPRQRRARSTKLVRTAATFTIAGLLVGGAGAVLNATRSAGAPADTSTYSLGSFQDRDSSGSFQDRPTERADRGSAREAPATSGKVVSSGKCAASAYEADGGTASGEAFDAAALTAAHRTLPFGTRVRITNPTTGAAVVVLVNDRGPDADKGCLALSPAAFDKISKSDGVLTVKFEVLAN
jgi:rare lipoprotein A